MVVLVSSARIPLLEADADIGRYLTAEERAAAETLTVPCVTLEAGHVDIRGLLERNACFGAFVVSGMLATPARPSRSSASRSSSRSASSRGSRTGCSRSSGSSPSSGGA